MKWTKRFLDLATLIASWSKEDAAKAYNKAAKQFHGKYARFNIIPGDTA